MGLGPTHTVGLADARDLAVAARKQLLEGKNPIYARLTDRAAQTAMPTFGEAAERYIESRRDSWSNAKHAEQWTRTLDTHASRLKDLPVDAIDTPDIMAVLKPIWAAIPETAGRVRGRIETILDAVTVEGHRTGPNPARWKAHLQHLLPPLPKLTTGHLLSLPYKEMPAFMQRLRKENGVAARALEWMILHANRPNETRFARREEFDGDVWEIPGERMKSKRIHLVPLTARSMEVLETLPKRGLLFPHEHTRQPLSENALTALLHRMGLKGVATAHGFRSTFRTWGDEETTFSSEVLEMALAHRIRDKTEAAYRRGSLLEKRRNLMSSWAHFLGT